MLQLSNSILWLLLTIYLKSGVLHQLRIHPVLSEGNHSRITLYRQGTNKCCVVFALLKIVKTQTQLFTLSYVRTEGKFNDAVITQGAEKKRKFNDNKLHKVETSC